MLHSPTPAVLMCLFLVPWACALPSPGLPCWSGERQRFLQSHACSDCRVYPDGRGVFTSFVVRPFHWLSCSPGARRRSVSQGQLPLPVVFVAPCRSRSAGVAQQTQWSREEDGKWHSWPELCFLGERGLNSHM